MIECADPAACAAAQKEATLAGIAILLFIIVAYYAVRIP